MQYEIKQSSILTSSAQIWVIPINSLVQTTNRFTDRFNGMFPNNVELCRRLLTDGQLKVGQCVLYRHETYHVGLMSSKQNTAPKLIANLVYMNHPAYAAKPNWLLTAVEHLVQQIMAFEEDESIHKIALHAKPLAHCYETEDQPPNEFWQNHVLPQVLARLTAITHNKRNVNTKLDIHV